MKNIHSETIKYLWKESLRKKNMDSLLSLYCKKPLFKGTFSNKTVKNKKGVKEYFETLFKDVSDVTFYKHPHIICQRGFIIENGDYKFHSSKGPIEAKYQFVFSNEEGEPKIFSHFSIFN